MIVAGYCGFTLDIHVSVRPGQHPRLRGYFGHIWTYGTSIPLSVKFRQILTELSAWDLPKYSFPDDNLSKCQGNLTKLGTCIDNKEIWIGIANGQIS